MKTKTEAPARIATTPKTTLEALTRIREPATAGAPMSKRVDRMILGALAIVASLWILSISPSAKASTAYGTLNNFDCVNDVVVGGIQVECHGFEIELDDVRSTDITYTYDWNHYGVPKITQDTMKDPVTGLPLLDPVTGLPRPLVFVRYAATWTGSGWSAFTAIPSGPILPTDGHQFTNPNVNFGGEHFGVGFYGTPSAVKYNWLIDDGLHNLIHGPSVYIATPTFTYNPPLNVGDPGVVVAAIVPPPPPEVPVLEFGEATWVVALRIKERA